LAYGKIRVKSRYQLFKVKKYQTTINIMFYRTNVSDRGAPNEGATGLQPSKPPTPKFKKHRFWRYDDTKRFYVICPAAEIRH
jgi:hypothetical protein